MQEMSSCSRSRTFCSADAGRFRKNLKIKMTGKTAGFSPHGEGRSRTWAFFANLFKKFTSQDFIFSLLIIVYSLLLIVYSSLQIHSSSYYEYMKLNK
jgi:hypothetical protein